MQKARRHPTNGLRQIVSNMVSGSISPFYSKYFSSFPHGTCSLSVSEEYLALPDGPGEFKQDSTCPALLRITIKLNSIKIVFHIQDYHLLWLIFPNHSTIQF